MSNQLSDEFIYYNGTNKHPILVHKEDLNKCFVIVYDNRILRLRSNKLVWGRKNDASNALRLFAENYMARELHLPRSGEEFEKAFQEWKEKHITIKTLGEYFNNQ